jgi:hypothetical protein
MFLYIVVPIVKRPSQYRFPTEGGANFVVGYNTEYRPSTREMTPDDMYEQPAWYFKDLASAKACATAWSAQKPGHSFAVCRTELVIETAPGKPVTKLMSEKGLTPE